jgi:Ca-activated chloride channel family protein
MEKAVRVMGCAAVLLFVSSHAIAFQGPLSVSRSPGSPVQAEALPVSIRVDASLVLIPVHVTTADGASVTDLPKESFRLFEDNVEQPITYFVKDDAPISIGVLLDTSGSMHNKMRRSSEAAATFFQTANPQDEFFLIEFNDRPKLTVPFTNDPDEVYRRVVRAHPFGRTSLLDAVHLASVQMKKARNTRKAILIISDGGDNRSRLTPRQVKTDVLESDMQTYAIGIFDGDVTKKRTPEEENGPSLLEDLAEETGGRHYRVDNLAQLASVAARISNDLRNEYLLGYSSINAERDGKYRRVKVNLNAAGEVKLRTFYRRGYYAPVQ